MFTSLGRLNAMLGCQALESPKMTTPSLGHNAERRPPLHCWRFLQQAQLLQALPCRTEMVTGRVFVASKNPALALSGQ
jgi:hypothetical protein